VILEGLAEPSGVVCLDVGAGTGISSRLVAERGCRVIAVEPNAAMREKAEPHERVEWREGTSEATGAADASVDLVLAAQAYHWFDEAKSLAEFARVLRVGGRVALMWNNPDEDDAGAAGYRDIMLRYATEPPSSPWNRFVVPKLEGDARFTRYRVEERPYVQALSCEALIGRAVSSSYAPAQGRAREAMEADLAGLYTKYEMDGAFPLRYVTRVYLAERGER